MASGISDSKSPIDPATGRAISRGIGDKLRQELGNEPARFSMHIETLLDQFHAQDGKPFSGETR